MEIYNCLLDGWRQIAQSKIPERYRYLCLPFVTVTWHVKINNFFFFIYLHTVYTLYIYFSCVYVHVNI